MSCELVDTDNVVKSFDDGVAVKRLVDFLPGYMVFYSYLNGGERLHLSDGMHDLNVTEVFDCIQVLIDRLIVIDALDVSAEGYFS